MGENVEKKKVGQFLNGQFKKTSKKAQALFIGRSIQTLTDVMEKNQEKYDLQLETMRFIVHKEQHESDENWIKIIVAVEVGSNQPFTEEDRKALEERRKKAAEERRKAEEETGIAAMQAMERDMPIIPPVEDQIQ